MITGNNKGTVAVGVPKHVTLHVCRVDKETTVASFTALLNENFPEAMCESTNSRFPEENFRKAMNPNVWPYGACISRFLERRTTTRREV
ncbi:hypothetical protein JTB14_026581 [Gonioctena quinquepunctata]|nr:hypothetical protein JTB14_026581 [Gonioctena quinquepunctata]